MTLLCNLFGQPGAGKSTARAEIFAYLKRAGVNCEEVYEFAKKLTWSQRMSELGVQPYITGKQLRDIDMLEGQVDVTVTDSPLLLSYFYGKKYCGARFPPEFYDYAKAQFFHTGGINYFIRRVKPYNPSGRNQTEAESDAIAVELQRELDDLGVQYTVVDGDTSGSQKIASDILEMLGKGQPLYPTKEAAYAAYGTIYQHYKGGVYRVLDVRDEVVTYEHLWPHPWGTFKRPRSEFIEWVEDQNGDRKLRFSFIKGAWV